MPYDWSNPYDSPLAYDIGNPQSATATGVATAESFGTVSITYGNVSATLAGIATAQSFSTTSVSAPAILQFAGIPTLQSFAGLSVNTPSTLTIGSIPSIPSVGSLTVDVVTIALVQSIGVISGAATTTSATFASPATLGNLIVAIGCAANNLTLSSVTDSAGNTYNPAGVYVDTANLQQVQIYYAPIVFGAGTDIKVTFHWGGTTTVGHILYEFSGVYATFPLDAVSVHSPQGSSGTAVSSTFMSLTSGPNDLIVGAAYTAGGVSGFEAGWVGKQTPANAHICSEYLLATARGNYAATFTQGSGTYTAVVTSFRSVIGIPVEMARIL